MKAICKLYTTRFLLTLMLTMSFGISGFAQRTLQLQTADKIIAAPGEPKYVTYGDGNGVLQATHVLRQTVYVNTTGTRTLRTQTDKVSAYQRWFNYGVEAPMPNGVSTGGIALSGNGGYYHTGNSSRTVSNATAGSSIACDISSIGPNVNTDNILIEPILAYRMIFDIRKAEEIAVQLENTSLLNPLEYYELTAPVGQKILIGPKYPYSTTSNNNFESNYYIGTAAPYTQTVASTSDGAGNFYWQLGDTGTGPKYATNGTNSPGNNSQITLHGIHNGHIFSLPAQDSPTVEDWYLRNSEENCIAHYRITYVDKKQVGPLEDSIAGRSSTELNEKYKLLVKRDFNFNNSYTPTNDRDKDFALGRENIYPLPWDECSYGFAIANNPSWSQYTFLTRPRSSMNWLYGDAFDRLYYNSGKTKMGMMFYVDASEIQGVVSKLDISDACCPGTQIYISTWIRNGNSEATEKLGPNLNFDIVGIDATTQKEITLKSFTTGTMGVRNNTTDYGNNWHQVFFEATVPNGVNFSSMQFQIINNQLGSAGNDYFIDDIEVYMMKPAVTAEVLAPMCGESAVAHINIEYQKLLDIVGLQGSNDVTQPIGYCFVDKRIYDNYLLNGLDKDGNTVDVTDRTEKKALEHARVKILSTASVGESDYINYFLLKRGFSGSGTDEQKIINYYNSAYVEEPKIDKDELIAQYNSRYAELMANSSNKILRSTVMDEHGNEVAGLSFQATLLSSESMPIAAGREYYIIFNIQANTTTSDEVADLLDILNDPYLYTKSKLCDVFSTFELLGTSSISVNGQSSLYHGGTDMCSNTRPTFTVKEMTFMAGDTLKSLDTESIQIYFDWFNGTFKEFKEAIYYPDGNGYTTEDNGNSAFSISEALSNFRGLYYSGTNVASNPTTDTYTPSMRKLLIDLTTDAESGFESDNTLVLYKKGFSPLISGQLGTIHYYLAIPISGTIVDKDENDNTIPGATLICLEPQQLAITSSALAPSFNIGIDTLNYRSILNVPIRIGLSQIKEMTSSITNPDSEKSSRYMVIPIQTKTITFSDEAYTNIMNVANTVVRYQQIYLVGSDDTSDETARAVDDNLHLGYINWLNISTEEGENKIAIYFKVDDQGNMPIRFREGYTYQLKFYFSEYLKSGSTWETANTCEGNVIIPLKIVPEYQVWVGDENMRNWNNDNNWRRAEKDDFYGPDTYISNNENYVTSNNRKSFVPLEYTKVIIDKKNNETPYLVDLPLKVNDDKSFDMTFKEDTIGVATTNIEYDMVVDSMKIEVVDGKTHIYYPCNSFYANHCDDIYFKPGASLMNPHLLSYDSAHVEFAIDTERWYLMGSPLEGVVAGDMYTLKSGVQNTNAFEDINFSTTYNNRFAPAVYQRGWDKVHATVYDFNDETNNSGVTNTDRNVAAKAAWSSVYNDVKVPYLPGVGFSIKSVPSEVQEKNIFRLPKADMEYNYYTMDGASDLGDKATLGELRKNSNKLASDVLKSSAELIIDLSVSNIGNSDEENKLYLLANPFMSHLDMKKFFTKNKMFEPAYWLMTADKQLGVIMDDNTAASATDTPSSIAPMQGFFVRLASGEANPKVIYTADMMTDPLTMNSALTRSAEGIDQLYITTTRNGISGTATVRMADESAIDGEMINLPSLLDSNWDPYALVYTIGKEGQAMQIQTVRNVTTIPLGIYSNNSNEVEVRFDNVTAFNDLALYDALLDETTPIEEGTSMWLPGNTNGRYMLTFASRAMEQDLMQSITISAVERGQIWVTSDINDPIDEIIVADTAGRIVYKQKGINSNSTTISLPASLYVVKVTTINSAQTGKVLVRN